MVKVREDMTGWKMWEHGIPDSRLIVIEQTNDYVRPTGKREAQWLCECNCKNHNRIIVRSANLKNGNTKSCGCFQKERTSQCSKKYNEYNLSGEYGIGYASNTGSEFYFDLEDFEKIKDYCWIEVINKKGYCSIRSHIYNTNATYPMHQLIFDKYCDHINRNPFDNRKCNLRKCTVQENNMNCSIRKDNKSGYIGVAWIKNIKKWRAEIRINKKTKHLGYFNDKEDAIRARLEAEAKYFGEFAPQRHLFEQYKINVEDGDSNDLS